MSSTSARKCLLPNNCERPTLCCRDCDAKGCWQRCCDKPTKEDRWLSEEPYSSDKDYREVKVHTKSTEEYLTSKPVKPIKAQVQSKARVKNDKKHS